MRDQLRRRTAVSAFAGALGLGIAVLLLAAVVRIGGDDASADASADASEAASEAGQVSWLYSQTA